MAGVTFRTEGVASEINVVPMIDILLVLIIIYMIINMQVRHVVDVQVPPEERLPGPPTQIVLELLPEAGFALNGQPVPDADLDATLAAIYRDRPTKLLFIKSAGNRSYQEVVSAMDRSRGIGVQIIGMVPK